MPLIHRLDLNHLPSIPPSLNGSNGRNRARGRQQIAANDDRAAILAWLARYADSPLTLANYRKESERLLLWCMFQHCTPLSDLTHEDLLLYRRFLADPKPSDQWVMAPGKKQPRSSPNWRPFTGPLAKTSQRQAMSILNAMFSWLVQAGYLAGNPLALSRKQSPSPASRVTRFLSTEHWQAIQSTIAAMPRDTRRETAHAIRMRWLFSLLYMGALRISEICSGSMGSFFISLSSDGQKRWWLDVAGKGGKPRHIPVTTAMLDELMHYRLAHGLPSLPTEDEDLPLILPITGKPRQLARSTLHEMVKFVARSTANRIRHQDPGSELVALRIEQMSAHWMRHTGGSHLSEKTNLKVVRDNLGHKNISTTSIYLHSEDDARHDLTEEAHRSMWPQTRVPNS